MADINVFAFKQIEESQVVMEKRETERTHPTVLSDLSRLQERH